MADSKKFNHEEYFQVFDPIAYLNEYYCDIGSDTMIQLFTKTVMDCLGNTLASGQFSGERFADICSGPCVHGAVSASKYFKDVYLTEYCPQSREYLNRWLEKQDNRCDWTKFFQYVAQLENENAEEVESRVRKSIRGILACDLLKEDPFEEGYSAKILPLDGILSAFTLEAAMLDKPSYENMLRKFASYLRPNGGLFLFGELNETYYSVGGKKLPHLALKMDFVVQAVEKAGFKILEKKVFDFETEGVKGQYTSADGQQYFYLAASK